MCGVLGGERKFKSLLYDRMGLPACQRHTIQHSLASERACCFIYANVPNLTARKAVRPSDMGLVTPMRKNISLSPSVLPCLPAHFRLTLVSVEAQRSFIWLAKAYGICDFVLSLTNVATSPILYTPFYIQVSHAGPDSQT